MRSSKNPAKRGASRSTIGSPPNESDPAEQDHLCDICKMLEFPKEGTFSYDFSRSASLLPFGRIQDIQKRLWCPFCRLVESHVCDEIRLHGVQAQPDTEIQLKPYLNRYYRATICSLGSTIRFVSDGTHHFPHDSARVVRGREIDIGSVKQWMKACISHHQDRCSTELQPMPGILSHSLIRAVDVVNRCIVDISIRSRYLTLSYVWGDVSAVRLMKQNLKQLTTRGSIDMIRRSLPRTIKDAIDFVSMLGEQFLWIDTLCLVSDDPADMGSGIQSMDMIYAGSTLNIIAATGFDANAGLPGVHCGSRKFNQHIEQVVPGVRMAVYRELDLHLSASRYSTRGWTYQEQLLPKRSVIFINNQVYWRCQVAYWSEETNTDASPAKQYDTTESTVLNISLDTDLHPWEAYDNLILYYSMRKLTYESDILNAMTGILNRLGIRMATSFFQGLPRATFDLGLLFVPNLNNSKDLVSHRRSDFPSYTWIGWRNSIKFFDIPQFFNAEHSVSEWLAKRTWIIWYSVDFTGVTLIWNPKVEPEADNLEDHIRYPLKRPNRLQRFSHFTADFSTRPTAHTLHEFPRTYPLLIFWTMAVYLAVPPFDRNRDIFIYDRGKKQVGAVSMKCNPFEKESQIEFLVLSECSYDVFSRRKSIKGNWDLYWVMAIVDVEGVKERIGLGSIDQSALANSFPPGPVWKEVVLG